MDSTQTQHATRFVLLTVFTYSVGFGIIMPVLPALIMELEGVSIAEATLWGGLVSASYAVFQFLMGPLVGNLGDRFGRRPIFLMSLLGFSIDFFLMGFATSIVWLFVGRSIAGALGAIFGPANAAMADMSSGEDRAKRFGLVGAAFGIGFIVGPAIGGILGEFGTRTPFFVASALALLNFVYGWFSFPETLPETDRREFSLRRANPVGALLSLRRMPSVLPLAAAYLMWSISANVYAVSWSYFATAQYGWEAGMIGLSLTCVGISMALAQSLLIGRMVGNFGERRTAIFAITYGTFAYLLYAFTGSATLAIVICFFVGVQGMAMPSINAMMSQRITPDMQGELQGFNGSLAALSALIAPLLYNTSLFYFTSDDAPFRFAGAPFIIAASLALAALAVLVFQVKQSQPQTAQ